MNDAELFWAALRRAPDHGASSNAVASLRAYVHAEFLAEHIDPDTTDRIGELLGAIEEHEFVREGDLIGPNATDIAWNVLEVRNCEGDTWRRAFGEQRFAVEDDGFIDREQEYDWIIEGGWSTTDGLLVYAPLTVTKVAVRPGEED